MKKLTDILNEIRVKTPGNLIRVTPRGKEAVDAVNSLFEALSFLEFDSSDIFEISENNDFFINSHILYIFSDKYGESMINLERPTDLDDYYKEGLDKWEDDKAVLTRFLEQFMNSGLIEKINI
jgi:hypothetical protein